MSEKYPTQSGIYRKVPRVEEGNPQDVQFFFIFSPQEIEDDFMCKCVCIFQIQDLKQLTIKKPNLNFIK